MLRWLALAVFLGIASATPYSCPKDIVSYPQPSSGTFYFPTAGADPRYQSSTQCWHTVLINEGYYAICDIASNLGPADRLNAYLVYGPSGSGSGAGVSGGIPKQIRTAGTSLDFILETGANATGNFSYKVTYLPTIPPMSPITYTLNDFGYATLPALILNYVNVVTFTMQNSNANVSISASCPTLNQISFSTAIAVNNGTVVDTRKNRSPYYTLSEAVSYSFPSSALPPEKQFGNRSLTLYNPMPNVEITDCGILAYDKRNVEQFSKVAYEYVTPYGNFGTFVAQATAPKPAALFINTANSLPATINALRSTTTTPDFLIVVYQGMPTPGAFNLPIAILTKDTPLPYKFTAPIVTLAMSSGSVYYNLKP